MLGKCSLVLGFFCVCTVIDETYSFVYICNNMFVHFHLSTCLLKVCVFAHNYYVMLMTKEIPLNSAFAVRPKSESSGLEVWRQKWTFNIYIPTLDTSLSTNKVFIFQLTMEDCFRNHFGLIRSKFLSLSMIRSVAFFLEHPVACKLWIRAEWNVESLFPNMPLSSIFPISGSK